MRNAVGIFVMLFAFVAVQAQTKVAHINSSQLIEAMPEADSIQKKLMKITPFQLYGKMVVVT